MTRNLRITGLALGVALIIGALGASAAQATMFHTKGGAYPAVISGVQSTSQVFKFDVEAGKNNELICKEVTLAGTLGAASTELTINPEYEDCTFSGAPAIVGITKCNFVLHSGAKLILDEYTGTVDIECPAGSNIVVFTEKCEIRITPQNGLKTIKLADVTGAGNVLNEFNIGAFAYSVTKDEPGCPLTKVENRIDGVYEKSLTKLSAKVGGVATPITVE